MKIPKRAGLDILTRLTLQRLVNTFSEASPNDEAGGKMEGTIMNMREATQLCRRTNGTLRAHFETQKAAENFAANPMNVDYHGDMAHLCLKCGAWHLSKPEWLVPDWAREMKVWN